MHINPLLNIHYFLLFHNDCKKFQLLTVRRNYTLPSPQTYIRYNEQQESVDFFLKACCFVRSGFGHLLLTSCPTLRADEEEDVDEEDEAWWRGLCLWGMWSSLGCDDEGPVWPCCWTQTQSWCNTWTAFSTLKQPLLPSPPKLIMIYINSVIQMIGLLYYYIWSTDQ